MNQATLLRLVTFVCSFLNLAGVGDASYLVQRTPPLDSFVELHTGASFDSPEDIFLRPQPRTPFSLKVDHDSENVGAGVLAMIDARMLDAQTARIEEWSSSVGSLSINAASSVSASRLSFDILPSPGEAIGDDVMVRFSRRYSLGARDFQPHNQFGQWGITAVVGTSSGPTYSWFNGVTSVPANWIDLPNDLFVPSKIGDSVFIQLQVHTFSHATNIGPVRIDAGLEVSLRAGNPNCPPPMFPEGFMDSFEGEPETCVPEPGTMALGFIGFAALSVAKARSRERRHMTQ